MTSALVVARREFLERVRSKWFLAMTVIGPLGMIALIVVPVLLATSGAKGVVLDIVDRSGALAEPLAAQLGAASWRVAIVDPKTPDADEEAKLRARAIDGYLVIASDALDRGPIRYRGDNASSQIVQMVLERRITEAVIAARARRAGLSGLDTAIHFEAQHSTGDGAASSGAGASFLSLILGFVLYIAITLYGVGVMRSVLEEKTSRVMELMLAAAKPRALLGGKILGVGAAGLVQVGLWLIAGALMLEHRDTLLGSFGVASTGAALPSLSAAQVAVTLAYFVMGFFLYAGLYAAAGAIVSSDQDSQQVQMPITLLLVVGVVSLNIVSGDPRGSSAAMMSLIPFWSPILMPMRYLLGGASLGDVALSFAILVISTVLVARGAAKIYRIGALMYGKRPTARELMRWLRY